MKIAVMGAGAVGAYYGALLARLGEEVHLIGRGNHIRAMRDSGLRVEGPDEGGARNFHLPPEAVNATEHSGGIGSVDWVLFVVKGPDTREAAALPSLLSDATFVLTLQNGVDSAERIAAILAEKGTRADTLSGVVYIEATLVSPGVVRHVGGPRRMVFGEADGSISSRAERVRDLLERTGIPVELAEDIASTLWSKFLYICPMSGMTAMTRKSLRGVLDFPETRGLYFSAIREVEAVARARGVNLPADAVDTVIAFSEGLTDMRSSLQKDLEAGKPLEIGQFGGGGRPTGEGGGRAHPHPRYHLCLPEGAGSWAS